MSWYLEEGKDSDVVISSRVRIARNMKDHKFVAKASEEELEKILEIIKENNPDASLHFVKLSDLDVNLQSSLVEKHVISKELLEVEKAGILINDAEDICIMINEEDHLRIQVLKPGLNLQETLKIAEELDDKFSEKIEMAYDEKYGYLTACPTNLGTGLRASCMLHLPALRLTGRIHKVLEIVNKVDLNVRGVYGEGTEAVGDLYQVSNKVSLGVTEDEIVSNITMIVQKLIEQERKAREYLKSRGIDFEDSICRAYGTLVNAKKLSYAECVELVSMVRLGISMGMIEEINQRKINEIAIFTKPATLQKCLKKELNAEERDIERCNLIRQLVHQ